MHARFMLLALFALSAPPPGLAVGPHQAVPQTFSVHDRDRDGYLSREEYAALRLRCQERRDGDGRPRCNPARLLDFDALDGDRDGRVAEDELVNVLGRRHRGGSGAGGRGEGAAMDAPSRAGDPR